MAKDIEISTSEATFIVEALRQKQRLDGRRLDQFRDVQIEFGKEYGDVTVRMGKTLVQCRISCQITEPYEDRPFEGLFVISTEISPMAGPQFENGNSTGEDEVLCARIIEKAVRRSGALDVEGLCIVAGSKCWAVRADVHYLNCDGGFIDASCIAVMTALSHFRKPDISVHGEDVVVYPVDEREPVPLGILHIPICVTFSFFNPQDTEENIKGDSNAEISIIDATTKEELLRDGVLTVTLNKNREVVQVSKAGGLPMDALQLMQCCHKAYEITEQLTDMILKEVKHDLAKRDKYSSILSSENAR
ncbi:Exosome complex component RRP45 [Nakaseomyces glabratus]|uniref:Exosome complex component RRP45 n=1 Tax=Candida glabrata TaxID=5478 RepID=A0A0W0DVZ5_CANGB|nr:3' exoribonuclease family, domain 2 [Nakaseomyces glabratus]KAH7585885.1 3' exoribonuclease family, domain 2 [Nakaseomyces glabratus]KAH7597561.1 3' exoribonuclease family, domain 2 [Nakaseomyces glabratus]KAH7612519.1 3' exoribonuclease family, domain 2 [Nakaseomyces glabratus]KAI8385068.1 3' exoribonuclease family, domain 2 [Nakaseomyces glabratus]